MDVQIRAGDEDTVCTHECTRSLLFTYHVLPPLLGAAQARLGARSSRRRQWVESEPCRLCRILDAP